jgi:hypothetical protein
MSRQTAFQTTPKTSSFPLAGGISLRKCACGQHTIGGGECTGCGQNRRSLQLASRNSKLNSANSLPASSIVHDVLRSPGQPLDPATRTFFEPRFGHDFSHVRVHTGGRAAQSARMVNALAYTVGRDVVFGEGQYAPNTGAGQRLIAHELTHTIQQGGNAALMTSALDVGEPNDSYEQEADRVADQALAMAPNSIIAGGAGPIPVSTASLRVGPLRIARELEEPEEMVETAEPAIEQPAIEQPAIPQESGATPMSTGPECSKEKKRGQSLPLASTAFRGERGFAHIPSDGHPGPGGLLVTGNSVSIKIIAKWEEQIPDPKQRPPDERDRKADSPQYYLSFRGWVDDCDSTGAAGSQASSVQSGNLAIGKQHTVPLASLVPGRYGLEINPSTAAAEPNRVLTGTVEVS